MQHKYTFGVSQKTVPVSFVALQLSVLLSSAGTHHISEKWLGYLELWDTDEK